MVKSSDEVNIMREQTQQTRTRTRGHKTKPWNRWWREHQTTASEDWLLPKATETGLCRTDWARRRGQSRGHRSNQCGFGSQSLALITTLCSACCESQTWNFKKFKVNNYLKFKSNHSIKQSLKIIKITTFMKSVLITHKHDTRKPKATFVFAP